MTPDMFFQESQTVKLNNLRAEMLSHRLILDVKERVCRANWKKLAQPKSLLQRSMELKPSTMESYMAVLFHPLRPDNEKLTQTKHMSLILVSMLVESRLKLTIWSLECQEMYNRARASVRNDKRLTNSCKEYPHMGSIGGSEITSYELCFCERTRLHSDYCRHKFDLS